MSTQKILQINPELFKFNGGKKSLKGKKERKTKPIQDKNQSVKSNKLKKELLKKVKDYQKNKETEKLKEDKKTSQISNETNNLFESSDFENSDFEREFNKSLTFLHDLSKKNKEKKKKKTLKTSNLDVNIEIPNDSLIYKNNKEPNYGCLKNGSKPTFRDLNKTQKNNIHSSNNGKRLQISLENNTYYDHSDFHNKYNDLNEKNLENVENTNKEENTKEENAKDENANKKENTKKDITKQKSLNEEAIVSINPIKEEPNNLSIEKEVKKEDPKFAISSNSLDYNNLSNNNSTTSDFIDLFDKKIEKINQTDIANDENLELSNVNSFSNNNLSEIIKNDIEDIPKLRRITRTYKYKLGKKNDRRHIGLLIKNRETQKKIKQEVSQLKEKDIQSIKNYLREKNLIKLGSQAPNDVLRKLYEDSILSGEITNVNNNNLVYNYLND